MRVLDLFSGIGGFSLGLERAGMETVAFCEYNDKCRQVLTKHWPDVPQYTDVRTLTGEQLERDGIRDIGLICGGFPCQGFSVAGKRKGSEDERHLWPEYFRLIQEIRPTWVIGENVTGIISLELDNVLADLGSADYTCQSLNIPACAVGADHIRERVWIIAHTDSHGLQERVNVEAPGKEEDGKYPGHQDIGIHAPEIITQGPGDYQAVHKPILGRNENGVSGRVDRLKQLGNAVVPQIPEMIGRAIMATNEEKV